MTGSPLYQSQRAMRKVREQAFGQGVIALLDVGSSKISCIVLSFDGAMRGTKGGGVGDLGGQPSFKVLGTRTVQSRGVEFGEIVSMAETERAIRTVVLASQQMANERVDHVVACFSGGQPRSYGLDGAVLLEDSVVTEVEIGRVLGDCQIPDIGAGRDILHAQPVNFSVDQRTGLGDPRGQLGQTLTTDLHLLTVDHAAVANLAYCIRRCDLDLAGLATSGYVAARAVLVEDEQELGAVCIDMGGGTTSLTIFKKKHMIHAETIRIGGNHVTRDIHQLLNVPMATAERLKNLHGGVEVTGKDDREMLALSGDTGDWERDSRHVSRADLIGIIRPRVEEILEEVRTCLDHAGFKCEPSTQVVLTGGASQIAGLDGLAAQKLQCQVRIGRPLRVAGQPQSLAGAEHAAVVGLSLFAAQPKDECWDFDLPTTSATGRVVARTIKWLRRNW
jgi:cell division protein FtsA